MVALQAGHWAFIAQCVCTPAQFPRDPPPGPSQFRWLLWAPLESRAWVGMGTLEI